MADVKLTASQQAVVSDRGGALLVSAAAGSGKTKVLVDRLLSRICDTQSPCNIDDFLVITYTNAAAAELRIKIAMALNKRIAEEPNNRHLQRQMNRIYLADISTVHAFCSNLLRTYAHLLDIPADFRMAEEVESETLQNKVLTELLERGYTEHSEDFMTMVKTFGYGRDDSRLTDAIMMAHKSMRCRADMDGWLKETMAVLDMTQYSDVAQTPWGKYMLQGFRAFLTNQIADMEDALKQMRQYPVIEKAYAQTFADNVAQMKRLLSVSEWDSICENLIPSFGSLGAARKPEDMKVKERIQRLRKACWEDLQAWQAMFYAPSKELLEDLAQVTPGTQALLRFAKVFDDAYTAEKLRRKVLDFSDLEHLAIRLLTDRYTGKPSKIAEAISEKYVEIMVDEYQDSNQVQEVIFEAVSRGGRNRFMVGDVKQSIYRFRLADPTLFLKKYMTYPDYQSVSDGEPRKILLSENFRSRPEILSACNDVFGLVMRETVGDLRYGEAEMLRPGKQFPEVDHIPVELHCLSGEDLEVGQDKRDLESEFVAERIRKLLDDQTLISDGETLRPVTPGDIVILMRSAANNAPIYLEALRRYGIPAVCNRGGSLLDTTEVQVLVAILQIIDNPHQDVPLLTALASPVFGYSPDTLAIPRTSNRKDDYYDAMQMHEDLFGAFFAVLDGLREDAGWMNLHELIDSVFYRTKIVAVFSSMTDGLQRERNLMAFKKYVQSFEATGSRALAQLLMYLKDLQTNGGQIPIPSAESGNAVNIMTIHKSKGLEFPVVFLADLSKGFNLTDTREAVLVDDSLAVGCNRVDHGRFVRYPTLAKKSIEQKKRQETISEELRILYVAMTRAKDMLIMTYYSKKLVSELNALNEQLTIPLRDDVCASVSNPGKWILFAALCRTEAGELHGITGGNEVSSVSRYPWKIQVHELKQGDPDVAEPDCKEVKQNCMLHEQSVKLLSYRYEGKERANFPAKLTATQLKGRTQDREAAEGAGGIVQRAEYQFRKARFLEQKMTAAEKGTATHLFMQFAKYENCTTESGIEEELHRLRKQAFLTPEQVEAVDPEQILKFFHSDLGKWLLTRKKLQREFKFSVLVDAGRYLKEASGEQVMLQGVVDCFVIEDDGITILDFKTDRVGKSCAGRVEYYRPQLVAYAEALARIYETPVKQKILYFFDGGISVNL